jgi:hypothetical protein
MRTRLAPVRVAERLSRLRALYVPESIEQARVRLEGERGARVPFPEAVARRLAELRALLELTSYLHREKGTSRDDA